MVSTKYIMLSPVRRDSEMDKLLSPASPYANHVAHKTNDMSMRYSIDNGQASFMNSDLICKLDRSLELFGLDRIN